MEDKYLTLKVTFNSKWWEDSESNMKPNIESKSECLDINSELLKWKKLNDESK